MSNTRNFIGGRAGRGGNPITDLVKLEIQKGGKLPPAARYKYILKKRMEAAQGLQDAHGKMKLKGATVDYKNILGKKISDSKNKQIGNASGRFRSKRAEDALKQIAMKKAAKEAKAMRKMVIVRPQSFANGSINSKGQIYDVANNMVGQVNTKNGNMATTMGWSFGKYKPRSVMTNMAIQEAINKYSPYYINLRKMQAMQQGMVVTEEVVNLYGYNSSPQQSMHMSDHYGNDASGPRQNIGVTAWGAMSNNTWGTFADNAWGTVADNAWGTASTDVWGGISAGSLWGAKGTRIWGTGDGKNYLRKFAQAIAALFGISLNTKESRAAKREFLAQHRSSNRSGGGSTSAPRTTTRR
ncbi:MAG: hypothetical protein ACK502_02215 [Alphaproteobacteria bacterium]